MRTQRGSGGRFSSLYGTTTLRLGPDFPYPAGGPRYERLVFDTLLRRIRTLGFLTKPQQQRTDAWAVLGAVKQLSHLETVTETLRLALRTLQQQAPAWTERVVPASYREAFREGLAKFLGGLATPAYGQISKGHPWFGKPTFEIKYDPEAAKKLMKEAGYDDKHKLKVKFAISTSGSGQMQPLPMNEFIQENLNAVGFEVELEVMEWEALRGRRRDGAFAASNKGVHGINNSWSFIEPDIGILAVSMTRLKPPAGYNWGAFSDPEVDALGEKAKQTFDPAEFDKILAEIHGKMVDKAMWIWVVHDLNPRALGPKVKGFVQAQSWFQDLTPVWVDK